MTESQRATGAPPKRSRVSLGIHPSERNAITSRRAERESTRSRTRGSGAQRPLGERGAVVEVDGDPRLGEDGLDERPVDLCLSVRDDHVPECDPLVGPSEALKSVRIWHTGRLCALTHWVSLRASLIGNDARSCA